MADNKPEVAVIMGSASDWETMKHACEMLDQFEVPYMKQVISAHRTPELMGEFAHNARANGLKVIIAGAGGAAHLPGMVAAQTTLPVIGVPVRSHALSGWDSLLSIVQMPGGIPVATTAAQLMTVAAEGTGIPVVYAAVSDPEQADLLDLDYVTGMSDALNTQFILDMMLAQDPEVQTVGLLYSLSEPNSTKPIAEAKEYLDGKGIAYKEYTANSVDEVIAAAGTLIADGVDAVFTPTDNKIMEAELAIAPELAEAGIPHYTGADSFVRNGAFTTCGVNYTDLGTQTADLAYQVASEGMDGMEDYYLVEGGIITVNTETAQTLGADYSMFSDMGQVVEVATTED